MPRPRLHASGAGPFRRRTCCRCGPGWFAGVLFLVFLLVRPDRTAAATSVSPSAAGTAMRLLQAQCLSCHGAEKQKGGLNLSTREALLRGGESGAVVDFARLEESRLLAVLEPEADPHMPPRKQLAETDRRVLQAWLAAGAPWDAEALAAGPAPRTVTMRALPEAYRPVMALALAPSGDRLALGRGASLEIRNVAQATTPLEADFLAHTDVVQAIAWSSDGRHLASSGYREVVVRDGATLRVLWTAGSDWLGRITALKFSPLGGALVASDVAVGGTSWLRVLAARTGKTLAEWPAHGDAVHDLALSPDGGVIATAGADKLIRLWEVVAQREVARLEGHGGSVLGVAFNTNATELVTVSSDQQLKVWDVGTRESVVTLGGRKAGYTAVAWAADGGAVVAADAAGRVTAYCNFRRHSGEQRSATADERDLGHWDQPVSALSVSRDGKQIVVALADGMVRGVNHEGKVLWELPGPGTSKPAGQAPAEAVAAAQSSPVSFVQDVLPVLSKAGCSAGACHAKPAGQNGFRLSVFSFDAKADFQEIVHEARGRRVFPAAPEESLLLLKPTMALEHGGGQRLEAGSEAYTTLRRWIAEGMLYQRPGEPTLVRIEVQPREGSYRKGESVSLRATAHYADASRRDVTALADFSVNDKEIIRVNEAGRVQVGQLSGEAVVVARFMGHVDAARFTVPADAVLPAERYDAWPRHNFIDDLAVAQFRKLALYPSALAEDEVFFRRSSLDVIGRLPSAEEVRAALCDPAPDRRERWVERLLSQPAYADYWANKWADLVRPNPDRVGVKSVFVLDQWLRAAFRENMPMDEFARRILVAEGSNHRDGPVVIYRDRREPAELTTMFSQLFLGVRMECARCHHHPNEKWSQDDFYQFAAFFGSLKQKGDGLSPPISAGQETFYFDPGGQVKHPVTDQVMTPRPLDGPAVTVDGANDPRQALARWLTDPSNPYFAKAVVNRVWAALFGRGFVEPIDDFRVSNPASNEPLLLALADDFARHGFDLKHLLRRVTRSRLYQLSSTPNEYNLADTKDFSRAYRRRLPAEVLLDAVNDVTGATDEFNGCPPGTRAMETWSYKVRSHFLDAFGRPNSSSDCPCERDVRTSVVQSLHMMNSQGLQAKLSHDLGSVRRLAGSALRPEEIVAELYWVALGRGPTSDEQRLGAQAFLLDGSTRQTATEDVLWALLNSPEFMFNH